MVNNKPQMGTSLGVVSQSGVHPLLWQNQHSTILNPTGNRWYQLHEPSKLRVYFRFLPNCPLSPTLNDQFVTFKHLFTR